MKTLLCIAGLTALIFFSSCNSEASKTENKPVADEHIEITPFIVNKVYLVDTLFHKHMDEYKTDAAYDAEFGNQYFRIDGPAFDNLGDYMRSIHKDSSILMYRDIKGKPMTKAEKDEFFVMCDSITESFIDKNGVEQNKSYFVCDSTSRYYFNSMIQFYETWYVNKKTKMIEKEQLGFSTWQWVEDKHAYRHSFTVFTNEAGRQKTLKYLKN